MKKITKLCIALIFILGVNNVKAQNLIPNWDAQDRSGSGTEANKWGFDANTSVTSTMWQEANEGDVRYRDLNGASYAAGGTFDGRELLFRWEGDFEGTTLSLGLPVSEGNTTDQKGIPLEAGKAYKFTGDFEWINNASAPTYEFSISDAPADGTIIATQDYTISDKGLFYPIDLYFEIETAGDYYIQVRQTGGVDNTAGGLIGLAHLNLEETPSLGIDDLETSNIASIHPNPVKNSLNIDTLFEVSRLTIYDALGRLMLSEDKSTGTGLKSIDVSTLSSGSYILHATIDNKIQAIKFLK